MSTEVKEHDLPKHWVSSGLSGSGHFHEVNNQFSSCESYSRLGTGTKYTLAILLNLHVFGL